MSVEDHGGTGDDAERDRLEGEYTDEGVTSERTVHGRYTRRDGEAPEGTVEGAYTDTDGTQSVHEASDRHGKYTRGDRA